MSSRELKNKPLVEAILEIRWQLRKKAQGIAEDSHYKLLLGRVYDRLRQEYPEHQPLEAASVPDEMVAHIVQHRFRTGPDDWPLVQIGPGIMTLNDTHKYHWQDFRDRAIRLKRTLYEAHPKVTELAIENLTLRYIDAVEIDFRSTSVWEFLRDKLKVNISLAPVLFEGSGVDPVPRQFLSDQAFKSTRPKGTVQLRIATGQRNDKYSLIWETIFLSVGDDLPDMDSGFDRWLADAHRLVDDWFFKMIDGELLRRFSGE